MPPPPKTRAIDPAGRPDGSTTDLLLPVVVAAAVLYFAREVLVPLALAILLSFVLAPLLRKLQGWRIPRGFAVVLVVLFAFSIVLGLGSMVFMQVSSLAADLPRYQYTIRHKVEDLQSMLAGQGTLKRAAQMLQSLNRDLKQPEKPPAGEAAPAAAPAPAEPPAAPPAPKPIPVEVHAPEASGLETIGTVLTPLLHPVATTGLIIIFVVFILLQREDLRNRLIRLAGSHDIQRTTAAIDDAAHRLSRLYLVQLALNGSFGVVIATGLWLIGVPSPILWGVIAAVMRFVPYVGSIMAAVFPLALALAVDPGWSMVIWTALLFAVVEPVVGNVIEPLVQGHSTGLSPVAVVLSAAFWTWLWGPVGLVLATPLTVCLVVLGRHVERLQSLDVLLGDRPPLSPQEVFYQRMLASDPLEAADQAETWMSEGTLIQYYDQIALGGLRLALVDHQRAALDSDRLDTVRRSVGELVEDLAAEETGWLDRLRGRPEGEPDTEGLDPALLVSPDQLAPAWRGEAPILVLPGRSALDEAAAQMLGHAFTAHGIAARTETGDALSGARLFRLEAEGVVLACLSYVEPKSEGSLRYAVRRIRRRLPDALVLVGFWSGDEASDLEGLRRRIGADALVTTIAAALAFARKAAVAQAEAPPQVPVAGGPLPTPSVAGRVA